MNSILALLFAMLFGGGICNQDVGDDALICAPEQNEQADSTSESDLAARIQRRRQRSDSNRISNGF